MTTALAPGVSPGYRAVPGIAEWRALMAELGRDLPKAPLGATPRHRRIVIPMLVGGSDLFALREGLIGHALRLRGADVVYVLCDGFLACDARTYDNDPADYCRGCLATGERNLAALGHRTVRASAFADLDRVRALRAESLAAPAAGLLDARHAGIGLGEYVFGSTLRYLRAGRFEADDPATIAKAREYRFTAAAMTEFARGVMHRLRPDKLLLSHGIYSTWGPWAALARALNLRYDVYSGGWRRNTLFLQHDTPRPFHCDDLWPRLKDRALSAAQRVRIDEYLGTREDNRADHFQYIDGIERDRAQFFARHAIDPSCWRRVLGLFTNVAFDGASYRAGGAFPDMFTWVTETVRRAAAHPDVLLLVKCHPAEVNFVESTPDAWRVANVLARAIPELPSNVRVIGPEDKVSPFVVYETIDAGLVNTSSVGLEMALRGLPVLTTAMGAHYDKPGLVLTPRDRESYFAGFDALAAGTESFRPDPDVARRYGYALYFRKSIPFEPLDVKGWGAVGIGIERLDDLWPGRFPGLDAICRGILDGEPFAAPENEP